VETPQGILRSVENVAAGEVIRARLQDGVLTATITGREKTDA